MITMTIQTEVPESRKVEIVLPAGVPVGPAEIEVRVRASGAAAPVPGEIVYGQDGPPRAFPLRPIDPTLAAEYDHFERMLPELMKQFAGDYVAIRAGQVIGVGDSSVRVLTAAAHKFPGEMIYVRRVTDQPEPLDRVTSHRIGGAASSS